LIGESGSGKSVTAQSIMQIVPKPGEVLAGEILFYGPDGAVDLAKMDPQGEQIRKIRGNEIAMIFQEPMTSLSPVHTIGKQITEMIELHLSYSPKDAKDRCIELLGKVGIPNPAQRVGYYPHQLSGGLRQRVMIAMALSCNPTMLIADEPTTALDVTVQAQILDLILSLQEQTRMSVFYITHDLGVIAEIASEVTVMYLGKVVELGSALQIFKNPIHPYTSRLLASLPKKSTRNKKLEAIAGNVPVPLDFPRVCGFYSRCHLAQKGVCDQDVPELKEYEAGHFARCFLA
jgi:peptide/nickel transport system ATP-binding protein